MRKHTADATVLLCLLCICSIPSAMAAPAPKVKPTLMAPPPAPFYESQRRRRRRTQDKTDQPKSTDSPSSAPSQYVTPSPTATPVTATPTVTAPVTLAPSTAAPSTAAPTIVASETPTTSPTGSLVPTAAPTFIILDGSVGNLPLHFSIHSKEYKAADMNEGRAPELVSNILWLLQTVMCENMGLVLVSQISDDASNICSSQRRRKQRRFLQSTTDTTVATLARLQIHDQTTENFQNWTEWKVIYPVIQIGPEYLQTALQNNPNLDSYGLIQEGLNVLAKVADLALATGITEGKFDSLNDMDAQVSPSGQEEATFTDDDTSSGGGSTETLDIEPLHSLRVAGIIMMCITLAIAYMLTKLSSRRRKEREWDMEYKERGGLVTEEGLDYMLSAGRRQTMDIAEDTRDSNKGTAGIGSEMPEDDEEGIESDTAMMLPMPGYTTSPTKARNKG